jgi:hypothetical protein
MAFSPDHSWLPHKLQYQAVDREHRRFGDHSYGRRGISKPSSSGQTKSAWEIQSAITAVWGKPCRCLQAAIRGVCAGMGGMKRARRPVLERTNMRAACDCDCPIKSPRSYADYAAWLLWTDCTGYVWYRLYSSEPDRRWVSRLFLVRSTNQSIHLKAGYRVRTATARSS